uniref:Endonuclease/exonuclease/phosphatase domain-containing protein n=1 Tax=Helicotheca tamesis TaxID=374047 RepID=A0A7S2MCS3_9STRA|mmetsp:Transcript_13618/g.18701  ORF Transcript_13618/g.18701 Transcript_13618/m.18701 type:complete len:588 (+) Transcript_13618:72-1835(+)
MVDPDYTAVSRQDPDSGDFPSSFVRENKDGKASALFPRSYVMRRRLSFAAVLGLFIAAATFATLELGRRRGHLMGSQEQAGSERSLAIATWNMAAINNNPFEYWITYDEDPRYEELMVAVEKFLEEPGDRDLSVEEVFGQKRFKKLKEKMEKVGWADVTDYWDSELKDRKIVSEFLKDPLLGSKRLVSMPDRVTNTINVVDSDIPACRPTVINMYSKDLSDLDKWFERWMNFMFKDTLKIPISETETQKSIPYEMLQPISKAKYPDITEDEEVRSLPLQTLCGAIFDCILVHMMNTLEDPSVWQGLKKTMVENLNKQKIPHTVEILQRSYQSSDIIALQEVSSSFVLTAQQHFENHFHVVPPNEIDATRDQNSILLLSKARFPDGPTSEITQLVHESFPPDVKVPVATGDILCITATDFYGDNYVIASFHGDTNGLATIPVVNAILQTMSSKPDLADHKLIFGLDANTYEHGEAGKKQDVLEFADYYVTQGLTSCWGDKPNPRNYTTFNARTYLQPQLNKACKSTEKREKGDVNPKDFILFAKDQFDVLQTLKDNTGEKSYIEDMAFPTLNFPSDHGILSTVLEPKN